MSRTKKYTLIFLGIASSLLLMRLVQKQRKEIPGLSSWQQVLVRRHGAAKAAQLVSEIRRKLAALVAEACLPDNPTLRWHLTANILPGLALYRTLLQEHGGDKSVALAEVEDAQSARVRAKTRLMFAPLKLLPDAFGVFKLVLPEVMKQYPAEGWEITYLENSADRVAFNITRCFYLDTLTAYGAPELTPTFCKGDDVMAEAFPPSLRFIRPHTLGRGDEMCDFEYCHVRQD